MDTTQQGGAAASELEPISEEYLNWIRAELAKPPERSPIVTDYGVGADAATELLQEVDRLRSALATATQEREAARMEVWQQLTEVVGATLIRVADDPGSLGDALVGLDLSAKRYRETGHFYPAPPQTDNTPSHDRSE